MVDKINTDKVFHLGSSTPKIGSGSMTAMLFRLLESVMNNFESGFDRATGDLNKQTKLMKDVAALKGLLLQITDREQKMDELGGKLQAALDVVKQDIAGLSDGAYKSQLEESLEPIAAFLNAGKQDLPELVKFYKDLAAFNAFMANPPYSKAGAKKLVELLNNLYADLLAAGTAITKRASWMGQEQMTKLMEAQISATKILSAILKIKVTGPSASGGNTTISLEDILKSHTDPDTQGQDSLYCIPRAKFFIGVLRNLGMKDGSGENPKGYSISAKNWNAAKAAIEAGVANPKMSYSLNLSDKLEAINKIMWSRADLPEVKSEYEGVLSALRQTDTAGASLSTELITNLNKDATQLTTMGAKLEQQMLQADRLVDSSLSKILRPY